MRAASMSCSAPRLLEVALRIMTLTVLGIEPNVGARQRPIASVKLDSCRYLECQVSYEYSKACGR
jgi:hypothetical protein